MGDANRSELSNQGDEAGFFCKKASLFIVNQLTGPPRVTYPQGSRCQITGSEMFMKEKLLWLAVFSIIFRQHRVTF